MAAEGERLKVLHIDDDSDFLDLFERKFSKFFVIHKMQSVDDALKVLSESSFDAIITDFEMPVKNGIELMKEMREKGIETPVIFCTGQGNEEIAREAFVYGASDYFTKDLHGFAQKYKLYNSVKKAVSAQKGELEKRAAQNKYRLLVENSHDIIYTLDKDGTFTFISPAWNILMGYSIEEALGRSFLPYVHPDDHARCLEWLKKVMESDERLDAIEYRVLHSNGSWRWHSSSGLPVKDANGVVIGFEGTATDITQRKNYEKALKESEATVRRKLQAILEPQGDMGLLDLEDIIDCQKLKKMMEEFNRITRISTALIDLKGKVLVSVGWQDICTRFHRCHPETYKNCVESDVVLAGGVKSGESKAYRCKNNLWDTATPIMVGGKHLGNMFLGQFFYEDEVPDYELFLSQARKFGFDEKEYMDAFSRVPRWSRETVNAVMAFYADVAEMIASMSYTTIRLGRAVSQKDKTMRQLADSEEKYRIIIESLNDGIWQIDKDARTVFVNNRMAEMMGYKPEEMIGKHLFEFTDEKGRNIS